MAEVVIKSPIRAFVGETTDETGNKVTTHTVCIGDLRLDPNGAFTEVPEEAWEEIVSRRGNSYYQSKTMYETVLDIGEDGRVIVVEANDLGTPVVKAGVRGTLHLPGSTRSSRATSRSASRRGALPA